MRTYLSLLGVQMQGVMWVAWMFLMVGLLWNGLPLLIGKGPNSGLAMVLTLFPCFYTVMLAYFLVIKDRTKVAKSFRLIPQAEFLISRPISRMTGYAVFMTIYFVLVIGPSVIGLAYASQNPALEFLCYKSPTQQTAAAIHQEQYLEIMPGSRLQEQPKGSPIIVWPQGAVFVAGWKLLIVVVLALMVQFIVFLKMRNSMRTVVATLVMFLPLLLMFLTTREESVWFSAYQSAFGFFTVHWLAVWGIAITLFLAAEALAFHLAARSDID